MEEEIFYKSITFGMLTETEVFDKITYTIAAGDDNEYGVYVGNDSHAYYEDTKVAHAIVLHHLGKGAIAFVSSERKGNFPTLRSRMYYEAMQSIEIGKRLTTYLYEHDVDFKVIIDVDIGYNGKTSELINEIIGYVTAEGFICRIKPESMAASTVADRYSR